MSRKTRTTTSPLTPKIWSRTFYEYALEANFFGNNGLIGTDAGSCIQVKTDLKVSRVGQSVRFQINAPLQGVGGGDNFKMTDVLESYDSFYFDLPVHERGHATGIEGPFTQQLMIEDWPETAVRQLADWKGVIMEKEIIKAMSGLYNLSSDVASVNELAPTANRILYVGENSSGTLGTAQVSDAALSAQTATDYLFGPSTLEEAVYRFMDSEPRPKLLKMEGRNILLCIMHPRQARALVNNTKYRQQYREADVRGMDNTLFRDSLGIWNCGEITVLLKSYGRIEKRTGAGGSTPIEGFTLNAAKTATTDAVATGKTVARALLLGAQAGAIGYGGINGQTFNRRKGDEDGGSGRKPFFGVDWIYGVSKTQFKNEAGTAQEDYCCYAIDTQIQI